MNIVKLSARLQQRHQPFAVNGLHLLRDEGLQMRKGLLVRESRCLIKEIIESNYKKGMELHTSVPSDDRIELGLDFNLFVGEAHCCH